MFLKQGVATHLRVASFLQCIAKLSWDIILMKDHAIFCHLNIKMMEFCLKNVNHWSMLELVWLKLEHCKLFYDDDTILVSGFNTCSTPFNCLSDRKWSKNWKGAGNIEYGDIETGDIEKMVT